MSSIQAKIDELAGIAEALADVTVSLVGALEAIVVEHGHDLPQGTLRKLRTTMLEANAVLGEWTGTTDEGGET